MSQAIPQYIPPNAPFVDSTGILTHVASVWLRQMWDRVGGPIAPTNNELAASEYADAGIESLQAEIYQLRDQIDVLQSMLVETAAKVASLSADIDNSYEARERIAVLSARLDGIDQGVVI